MPRGSKAKYTDKQKRQAEHIEESYEKKGASKEVAEKRAWQTVNKQTGGGGKKATPAAKKAARKESGERAAKSRKVGSAKVQKTPTRKKASVSAKK